jgi:Flp pilus assembly protein TadG
MVLIFGIVDFGRMLSAKITITEAAREGARAAALVSRDAGVTRVYTATADLPADNVTPEVVGCPDSPGDASADATATVTYTFQFVTPVGFLFGGSDGEVDLVSTGIMPCLS